MCEGHCFKVAVDSQHLFEYHRLKNLPASTTWRWGRRHPTDPRADIDTAHTLCCCLNLYTSSLLQPQPQPFPRPPSIWGLCWKAATLAGSAPGCSQHGAGEGSWPGLGSTDPTEDGWSAGRRPYSIPVAERGPGLPRLQAAAPHLETTFPSPIQVHPSPSASCHSAWEACGVLDPLPFLQP